ncbi:class I SAM-dependent methyltransferase [Rhodopirellula europaea]|uniref:Methyltransferase type 11 domain protein n=1 Tax=Rhodopirellula europaea SH398 TaxID=1263868 RepID=M5RZL8_9BACT|nr:class I SAM-dependent methyltransferase [Rhodopirellula europaea]EMI24755.1 Methyltransferase type 11 domain protein [Rhodopirellula europaea SH398]
MSDSPNEVLKKILVDPSDPKEGVFDFGKDSEQSKFYKELFSEDLERVAVGTKFEEAKSNSESIHKEMDSLMDSLRHQLSSDAIVIEIGGGVFQNRCGNAVDKFANYFPLDISFSSIARYSNAYGRPGVVADATNLPILNDSVDCVFTHTFLEHPLEPDKVVSEIARIVKPGGLVVHRDAWHCRWWHRFGCVRLKSWSEMTLKEKLVVAAAKFTELPLVRFPPLLAKRAVASLLPRGDTLKFKRLSPNYELHLGCDEDAASSIDPINVVRFYEFHGFELVTTLSLKQRILFRQSQVILRKASK